MPEQRPQNDLQKPRKTIWAQNDLQRTKKRLALPITTANFKMGEELYLTSDIAYLLSPRSTNVSKMKGLKMFSRGPENEVRLTSAIISITNLILIDTVMY